MKTFATILLGMLVGAIASQFVQRPPRDVAEVREVVARAFGGGLKRCYAKGDDLIICGDVK